jgi:hypothetical protein
VPAGNMPPKLNEPALLALVEETVVQAAPSCRCS